MNYVETIASSIAPVMIVVLLWQVRVTSHAIRQNERKLVEMRTAWARIEPLTLASPPPRDQFMVEAEAEVEAFLKGERP